MAGRPGLNNRLCRGKVQAARRLMAVGWPMRVIPGARVIRLGRGERLGQALRPAEHSIRLPVRIPPETRATRKREEHRGRPGELANELGAFAMDGWERA